MCEVATIERFCKPGVAGLVRMYLMNVDDILTIPAPNADWVIENDIIFKHGAGGWKTVSFREQAAGLADELVDAIGGGFRKNLGLKIPKYGDTSNKWIYNMVGTRFIVLIEDFNQQVIMVGDLNNPVHLEKATGNTGQKIGDDNGWAVVMMADTTKPCYLYTGKILPDTDKPLYFMVYWGWQSIPFTTANLPSFNYQAGGQFPIHNTTFVTDFINAPPNSYLAFDYPQALTFTKWKNTDFNFGQIPDQVFNSIYKYQGRAYAYTRVMPVLDTNNKQIIFS